ncbi:MAG: YitT family protein [Eubacteriales bacterium]
MLIRWLPRLKVKKSVTVLVGSAILAFGLYNVHSLSGVTEGGVLGLTLLFEHHFGISPSLSGLLLNLACYLFGIKTLGREFLCYSALSSVGFSGVYFVCERIGYVYPAIADHPLVAAIAGAVFVGVGAGLSVRAGGATGGDDALSMSLSRITGWKIERIYLVSDLAVLALSLTYIPVARIAYSLLTVIISGQLIGLIDRIGRKKSLPQTDNETV